MLLGTLIVASGALAVLALRPGRHYEMRDIKVVLMPPAEQLSSGPVRMATLHAIYSDLGVVILAAREGQSTEDDELRETLKRIEVMARKLRRRAMLTVLQHHLHILANTAALVSEYGELQKAVRFTFACLL